MKNSNTRKVILWDSYSFTGYKTGTPSLGTSNHLSNIVQDEIKTYIKSKTRSAFEKIKGKKIIIVLYMLII